MRGGGVQHPHQLTWSPVSSRSRETRGQRTHPWPLRIPNPPLATTNVPPKALRMDPPSEVGGAPSHGAVRAPPLRSLPGERPPPHPPRAPPAPTNHTRA
eukprot:579422-Prorocentrum_minimum.AAC.1